MKATTGIIVTLLASIAHAGPTINVEAGDAKETLKVFGRQTRMSVVWDPESLAGVRTRAIAGETNLEHALRRMLKGSRITYKFTAPRYITFFERTAPMKIVVCMTHEDVRTCTAVRAPGKDDPRALFRHP